MKPILTIVAAIAKNHVIGKDQRLPWNLPDDWHRLLYLIKDQDIVMGRKTFQSHESFLTRGKNYIMSRSKTLLLPEQVQQIHQVEELFSADEKEIYVLGGAGVYQSLLPHTDRMLLTEIEAEIKGDTQFPDFDRSQWDLLSSIYHPKNDRHSYGFYFNEYVRKR